MPDWDVDSTLLRANLRAVLADVADLARQRRPLNIENARVWQSRMMQGLDVPDSLFVGLYRGEAGLEGVEVQVGLSPGVSAIEVPGELAEFETRLTEAVVHLDQLIPAGTELDQDGLYASVDLAAWAHAEWVRRDLIRVMQLPVQLPWQVTGSAQPRSF